MKFCRRLSIVLLICIGMLDFVSCKNKELSDGNYYVNVTMEGGSGRASITSPAKLSIVDGQKLVTLVWSSPNYDYMVVNEVTYYNENEGGPSTFTIPIDNLEEPLNVIGDTTAMSVPHEIEYTLTFEIIDSSAKIEFNDLVKTGALELQFASQFSVDEYGEYKMITIGDSDRYLLIPENYPVPKHIDGDITVLKQPLDNTYLVSSSQMDLIAKIGAIDNVKLSGIQAKEWYVEEAKAAMEANKLLYAGKYSTPDYEVIVANNCNLAVENTMIYHCPGTKEKLEELGIPVLVEYSSYESNPLGRVEWIKLYGIMFGKEEEADTYFIEQVEQVSPLLSQENTGKTAVVFYVNSNGVINVKKPGDYIAKMIEMAGGNYKLSEAIVEEDNALSSMNMQMEDFYVAAKDADVIIYNSTIDGGISSISDLISTNKLFSDFKAVNDGQVYCTSKNFFQESTGMAEFVVDLNKVFNGETGDYTYLEQLK